MAQTFFPITPVEVTLGTAGSWQDVNVSAYVPAGTTGAILHLVNKDSVSPPHAIGLRKNGSTDSRITGMSTYITSNCWAAIGVDASRIFEAYVGDTTNIDIYLVGYTTAGVTFFTNAYDKSLVGLATWTDIDCSAVTPSAVGLIFEVLTTSGGGSAMGLRKDGSSDSRVTLAFEHACFGVIIGCSGSQICEGYTSALSVDFYLVGYITDGCTFNTNATDVSLGSTGSWVDLTALPANSVMGFIEISSTGSYNYDLRKNGSAEAIYYSGVRHPWAFVECDASYIIEGKIASVAVDFFLVGYATIPQAIAATFTIQIGLNPVLARTLETSPDIATPLGLKSTLTRIAELSPELKEELGLLTSLAYGDEVSISTPVGLSGNLTRAIEVTPDISTQVGLLGNLRYSIEQTFTTAIGLVSNLFKDHLESFSATLGLNANLTRQIESNPSITTQIGLSATLTKFIELVPPLKVAIGLIATLTRAIESSPPVTTAIGLVGNLKHDTASILSTATGLLDNLKHDITNLLKQSLGLNTSLMKAIETSPEVATQVGLNTTMTKEVGIGILTKIGLVSTLSTIKEVIRTLLAKGGLAPTLSRAIEVTPDMAMQIGLVSFIKSLGFGLAELRVYVDWDNDGNFTGTYDEITSDVKYLTIRRGRSSELGIAEAGTLELRLTDPDRKYSPENNSISGVLYGKLLPKRPIKVTANLGGVVTLFYGFLENLICHPKYDEQETYLYAIDGLDFLSRAEISSTLYKSQQTGVLISAILTSAGWPAGTRDIETGQLTVPLAYWDGVSAKSAIEDLQASEFKSFAYIDNQGYFCWEDGIHRDSVTCQATFLDTYPDIGYEYGAKSIYNEIRVTYRKWELQPLAEIWRLEEVPTITAGTPKTFWASFADLTDTITTPVITTDYLANTQADGLGTDKSTQIGITITKFAQSAKLVVTNSIGTVYLTLLRLRGELYDSKSSVTVKAEDTGVGSSQALYQKRTLTIDTKFQTDAVVAQAYADAALAKYKDPKANITLTLIGITESMSDQLIHRQVSDKIRVVNTRLGLDKYFFIEQVNYTFSEGNKKQQVTWILSEA